ncbi:hypothetical protein LOK49_LG06G00074 [Camellia lanceoleosa]|uniref:Uncharacterized protein n=1 Tax=Camellia lanceoleosa TaxID=1840588 RepID=A0ACC0HE47_9ERIC|nr:hypothetical protein LOK49_LG06G00074 [Camellia lanceoleosa]
MNLRYFGRLRNNSCESLRRGKNVGVGEKLSKRRVWGICKELLRSSSRLHSGRN